MKVVKLNRFGGGMTNNNRYPDPSIAQIITQFDITSEPNKLIPLPSVSADDVGNTEKITQMLVANGVQYGLGVVSGQAYVKIFQKSLSTYPSSSWSASSSGASAGGARQDQVFVHYKNYIYGLRGGSAVWKWGDITGAPSFTETERSLSYTNAAQGLVHSKDDIMYLPYDNKIARNNNGTWTDAALTLPSNLIITSICEQGNFIMIACKPKSSSGQSVSYLWDRDASLTTLSDVFTWGEGDLQMIEQYTDGTIVGVVTPNSESFDSVVSFRYWRPGMPGPKTFTELTVDSGSTSIIGKQLANNKIFFLMSVTIDEVVYEGLWSIATPEEGSGLSLSLEYMLTNATATSVTAATLRGFFVYANHAFLSFQNSSGTYILNRTARTFAYAATSKYTTGVNPGMDPMDKSKEKQLTAVSVSYEALPTDASMTLEYRVDGGSWTTIFTETTNSAVNTERIMDASGAEFTKGRDYEFRLGSTGGGEIVELAYAYESLSSLMHP